MCGSPTGIGIAAFIHTAAVVTGHGQKITGGFGSPIMIGDGLRSTMAAGLMTLLMAGFGFQVTTGHRHG